MVKKTHLINPRTYYKFIEKIGEGNYSQVYKVKCLSSGQFRVIKKVDKLSGPKSTRSLLNEFDILREMVFNILTRIIPIF